MSTPSQTERFKSAEYAAQQGEYTNAAKIVYDLAIENHPESLLLLGSLCLENDKLGGNRRAAGFFLKAADEGSAEARCKFGHLCELGEGVPRNENRALALFKTAAEQNFAEAQLWIGLAYAEGRGVRRNLKRTAEWLTKAAANRNADAQGILGTMYATGRGVPKNDSLAIDYLDQAAHQGLTNAQFIMDLFYLNPLVGRRLAAGVVPSLLTFLRELGGMQD